MTVFFSKSSASYEKLAYDFSFNDLDGTPLNLSEFKNKVIIVINVASQCGFTRQYSDMQNIWEKYEKNKIKPGPAEPYYINEGIYRSLSTKQVRSQLSVKEYDVPSFG